MTDESATKKQIEDALRVELDSGLTAANPEISPKYFYDELGSQLFTAITLLTEYYPPRIEADIFESRSAEIAKWLGPVKRLVDIGAADGRKAAKLFNVLGVKEYIGVDISGAFLQQAIAKLSLEYPSVKMQAQVQDFSAGLSLPAAISQGNLYFYPGSSLGNFTPEAAVAWLASLLAADQDGSLLLGIDRVKSKTILDAAYDDAVGVTASFNLNMLRNVNRVLGSDFDPRQWQHLGYFNVALSRVEMHLQAKCDLTVTWLSGTRQFMKGQTILTECSYKYTAESITALLKDAGYRNIEIFSDRHEWFSVVAARR